METPLERDASMVMQNVLDEKVSLEQTRQAYGVILSHDMQRVDEEATRLLRAELVAQRIYLKPTQGREPEFEGGVRVAYVSPTLGDRGFYEGEMVEICAPKHPATFRVRAEFDDKLPADVLLLDEEAWNILEMEPDDRVWWRKMRSTPIGS